MDREGILQKFSAPYHAQSLGLFERSNQSIQDVLNRMGVKKEEWDLYLLLAQYSYNTMPRPMLQKMSSYEVLHEFHPPEFVRFTRKPQLPEHCVQTCEDFIRMRKKCC